MNADIKNTTHETPTMIEKFLESGNDPISVKLGMALIENFGGVAAFLADHKLVNEHGITGGYGKFVFYNTMVDFYATHKKQIRKSMEAIAEENGFDSLGDFIWDKSVLSKDWSKNEVLEGLYKPTGKGDQDLKDVLYSFQVQLLGATICQNYEIFLDGQEQGK